MGSAAVNSIRRRPLSALLRVALDSTSLRVAATILIIGLVAFIALVAFQVRLIIRSPFPGLRAIEALATCVPLFLLLFAATYVVMASISTNNFGEHLSHTDGLYFTVTVFSTVGFGDIAAKMRVPGWWSLGR